MTQSKGKKKALPPRRMRMKRDARLQAARHWLPTFTGKNVVRGYAKWFRVDLGCALEELQVLGVTLDPTYVARLTTTLRNRPSRRKAGPPPDLGPLDGYGTEWDDQFAYIAGRTPAGFAYGITWEEWPAPESE